MFLGWSLSRGEGLAVFVDGGEEVQGPRGVGCWVGEGAVDSEGGVELP